MRRFLNLAQAATRLSAILLGAVAACALATAPAAAEPALWVVKSPTATIYLFGSVHILKPDANWLSPKIKAAFERSSTLQLEVPDLDDKAAAQAAIMKHGIDPAHSLSSKLTPQLRAQMTAAAAEYGLPAGALEIMKPWLAALMFDIAPLQKAGWDGKSGVELNLMTMARARKEPVAGFETIEQQVAYFDSMPEAAQVGYLQESLKEAPKMVAELDKVEHAWEAGDVDVIAHALNDDMKASNPQLYDLLLTQRNIRFADQIATMLKTPGVTFVAVGAAHLAGPDSVQAQLDKHGIHAERLRP